MPTNVLKATLDDLRTLEYIILTKVTNTGDLTTYNFSRMLKTLIMVLVTYEPHDSYPSVLFLKGCSVITQATPSPVSHFTVLHNRLH